LEGAAERYRRRFATEEISGPAFRAHLEASGDLVDLSALAHLNRLTAFSTQLRLLGLAERDFEAVQRAALEEFASRLAAPGLSAEVLGEVVTANFPGVFR
jgi:hypothetical protein